MQEWIFEIASRIQNPITVVAFVIAFLGIALYVVVKAKNKPIAWLLASGLILIGIIPVFASTILSYHGVYHLRLTVLNLNNQPTTEADVKASTGEERKTNSGWEFEISPQTKPSNGKVTLYAAIPDSYLAGQSTVILDKDYYPSTEIHLQKLPSAPINGEVVDENLKAIADVDVILPECSQTTKTNKNGLFSLPSCVALGQQTSLHAEKGDLTKSQEVFGGQFAQIQLTK